MLDRALDGPQTVHVSGGPGSGKSAAAREIVAIAEERGKRPLLVAPPSGAADAGVLALANVARRLGGNESSRGGWSTVRSRTRQLLSDDRENVVLVIDEPSSWAAAGGIFARRADEAAETMFGSAADWPVIVCDQNVGRSAAAIPPADPRDLVTREWGLLADAASELSLLPVAGQLRTPLQQRLAAALVAWGHEPEHLDPHRLGGQLAAVLTTRRHGPPLWGVWQRLALARTPLDGDTLDALGVARLSPLAEVTLRIALLDGADRLHDVLRTIPEDRPPDPELVAAQRHDAHQVLYEHHYARFVELANADQPDAADHAAEALFHAGELEDETRISLIQVDLVEQLNALGHRVGTVHGDHRGAAIAYERAVLLDPEDAHAIHHLAFHRDAQGVDRDATEAGYAHALRLEPAQPHWRARQVAFLVDTARPNAARRAWAQAESALADDRGDSHLYARMHIPTAATLLGAGELAFCDYVLDGVPAYARNAQYRELAKLLTGRLAGQDEGAFVPAPRSGGEWWQDGPDRLPARDTAGRTLASWLAGRVVDRDDQGVDLHVTRVNADSGPYGDGLVRMAFDILEARLLDAIDPRHLTVGRFLEIGRYRGEDIEDRTGVVVLSPHAVSLPVDVLPISRWEEDAQHGSSQR